MVILKPICVFAAILLIYSICLEVAALNPRVHRVDDDFNIPLPFGNINIGKGPDGKRKVGISHGINIGGHGFGSNLNISGNGVQTDKLNEPKANRSKRFTDAVRYDELNHWMVDADAVLRCALCDGRARKMYEKCGVGLPEKCFKNFHVAE